MKTPQQLSREAIEEFKQAYQEEAEYDRVQTLLGRSGNPRPQTHRDFAFTGMIRCGDCNSMVTAEEKHQVVCGACRFKFAYRKRDVCPKCATPIAEMKNPLFLHYTYYHCSRSQRPECRQRSVRGQELERQISERLARISISKRFRDWAVKYLHELHKQEGEAQKDDVQARQKAYEACLGQIDSLVNLKTSSGNRDGSLLSDDEYAQRQGQLLKEKATLEAMLDDVGGQAKQPLELSKQTLEFACAVQERFAKGDCMTKKAILTAVGSNLILKDKKLLIKARKPFVILENGLRPQKPVLSPIEPEKTLTAQGLRMSSVLLRPSLLGGLDDVRTLNRTLGRQYQKLVREVYTFFQKRPACPCEDCQHEFFEDSERVAKRFRRRRWNALPTPAVPCKLKAKSVARN